MSYSSLPMIETPPQPRRGCFLFTPLGCIFSSCIGMVACLCLVIVVPIVGVGTLIALLYTNSAVVTGNQSYRMESNETGRLEINDDNAKVNLIGSTGNLINIDYELKAYGFTDGSAQSNAEKTIVEIQRLSDGTITVTVDDSAVDFSVYELSLDITVPTEMQTLVINSDDDVNIRDVEADFVIDAGMGDVSLTDVRGSFDVRTSFVANINFSGELGLNSTNNFHTALGDITMTIQGKANMNYNISSGGDVTCPEPPGSSCSGRFGDGSSSLQVDSDSGDIIVTTSQ